MEVMRGVRVIEGMNGGRFPYCNVVVVGDVVIDAGAGLEVMRKVNASLLVLSHLHPDHSSGAWLFKDVLAPAEGRITLDTLARRFVAPDLVESWKRFISAATGLREFECERYEEGVVVKEPEIVAVPVKGHTMDHHVFLIEQKVLFGADVDLTSFGPFYGNPEADPYLFEREMDKLLDIDFEIFVSAHSKPVFGKEEAEGRILEFKRKIKEREEIILSLLEEPKSLDELVELSPIYGRKPYAKEILDFFERVMIEKHIEKLEMEGRVRKEDGKYVRV
ncbi:MULTISPECIES: MBL fold metallo-hydrolase [Archaeoglobus]|jgi:glyoxylase-like metal-dependent hydrolase (beta-lactamase superfamily II)|uniref:Dehydrase, putative n=3 Tax=Archaeoglobus fulgidus TaxID=2234 RepID=O28774_ARCFU|nr:MULTISPECIES: MBL fold metallo-hydrolase [Archaeoglobus]AAB89745.1 dehydrase, putative [Archaeoglobus fulgidus DSM 4304]AIG98508.1 Zn-dependent hydrolase [Archaeoglobus fulgidus DSM 8774]KUJ94236.1 MAG: Dehydrase, putative [Archaeoglobus fulgidus]KUK06775.1 MAG: Dehydrase, putative [Archaeoglobus fulgidus]MDI3497746.1 hypothetical protein [Archaeoglobus sp.]